MPVSADPVPTQPVSGQPAPAQPPAEQLPLTRRLATRLVVASLVASMLVAIGVSVIQIYSTYNSDVALATQRFAQIESSYLPSLADNLWEVNRAGVDALLQGLRQLPDVGEVTLVDETGQQLGQKVPDLAAFAQREFVLRHTEGAQTFVVGRLQVALHNEDILAQLIVRSRQIAVTLLAALLVNALVLLVLLRQMIMRHLVRMARFAASLDIVRQQRGSLTLERKPPATGADELDQVVNSLNDLQTHLYTELQRREATERHLRDYQAQLESRVEERTLACNASVRQLEVAASVGKLGVWKLTPDRHELEWNERMFAIYEYTPPVDTRLSFEKWQQFLHPDDAAAALAEFGEITTTRAIFDRKLRIITARGHTRSIHARAQAVVDDSGRVAAIIGINYDITEEVEAAAVLREAKAQADSANAAKSEFLANISHEIRTPMNAVLGMLQLVHQTDLTPHQRDYLGKATVAAKALLGLLNDTLDYSKIEAGKLDLDLHPFAPDTLLQELGVVLAGNRVPDTVQILFDMDPQIPPELIGDALRLQQVLVNLAGNALKFTADGHVLVRIDVLGGQAHSVQLRFAVEDTGIGISPEQQQRIFEAFTQAESSTTRRFGGTGLGLVICKRLIALMGGQLLLRSAPGQGSCFWFDLSFACGAAAPVAPSGAPLPVLVAGASPLARQVSARALTSAGWRVTEAASAAAVPALLRAAAQAGAPIAAVLLTQWPDAAAATALIAALGAGPTAALNAGNTSASTSGNGTDDRADDRTDDHTDSRAEPNGWPPAIVALVGMGQESAYPDAQGVIALAAPATPARLQRAIRQAVQRVAPAPAPRVVATPPQRLAGVRLLVVDDNHLNRQVAFELLSSEGARVELASDGREGVAKATALPATVDAVLMDMQMPDMDGLEATRHIRAVSHCQTLPILAMTANASTRDRDQCLAAGMNGHLGKPFELDELVAALRALLALAPAAPAATAVAATAAPAGPAGLESPAAILHRFGGKEVLFRKVLAGFAPAMAQQLAALQLPIAQQDSAAAAEVLHMMKGMALSMGAAALGERAAQLEAQLKAGAAPELLLTPALPAELEQMLAAAVGALDALTFPA